MKQVSSTRAVCVGGSVEGSFITRLTWTPPVDDTFNSFAIGGENVWSADGPDPYPPRHTVWLERNPNSRPIDVHMIGNAAIVAMSSRGVGYNPRHLIAVDYTTGDIITQPTRRINPA